MWGKNKQDQNSVGIMALYHGPVVLLKTWHLQEGRPSLCKCVIGGVGRVAQQGKALLEKPVSLSPTPEFMQSHDLTKSHL